MNIHHGAIGVLVAAILCSGLAFAEPHAEAGHAHAHFDARYGHNHSYVNHGVVVGALPHEAIAVGYGPNHYWFSGGIWYRANGGRFVVIAPPIGVVVSVLPPYYTTLMIGGIPYYYANDAYYVWKDADHGYEVVDPPPAADSAQIVSPATAAAGAPPTGPDSVFVYPKSGQSAEQQDKDRYECHRWSVEQTGFDPVRSGGGVPLEASPVKRADYFRALNACLEARGYTVR